MATMTTTTAVVTTTAIITKLKIQMNSKQKQQYGIILESCMAVQ